MKITKEFLKACCPQSHLDLDKVAQYINQYFPQFGIQSNREVRYWLAQCFEETDGLKTFREYASGSAYEGRQDLGNTHPGDGQRFRGRGMIMTTGRNNYTRFSAWLALNGEPYDVLGKPEILETPKFAVLAACFYYQDHVWSGQHIKSIIAGGSFENLTKAVNGGLNGYQTRLEYLGKLNKLIHKDDVLETTVLPSAPPAKAVTPVEKPPATGFIPELMALITKYFGAKK